MNVECHRRGSATNEITWKEARLSFSGLGREAPEYKRVAYIRLSLCEEGCTEQQIKVHDLLEVSGWRPSNDLPPTNNCTIMTAWAQSHIFSDWNALTVGLCKMREKDVDQGKRSSLEISLKHEHKHQRPRGSLSRDTMHKTYLNNICLFGLYEKISYELHIVLRKSCAHRYSS